MFLLTLVTINFCMVYEIPQVHSATRFVMIVAFVCMCSMLLAQNTKSIIGDVNVFVGTSGDHGQLSPGASYPFSMMDICAQTYPNGHTGYEYKAKTVLGFTHNRFEGVGCEGSGGNILITPFDQNHTELIKQKEWASPGNYSRTSASDARRRNPDRRRDVARQQRAS